MNRERELTVFIVDDDEFVRDSLADLVQSMGRRAECFGSAEHFLISVETPRPGVMVLDVRMPGMSGLELQRRLREVASFLPIIIVTGHGSVPVSVEAMRAGALDVFEKPYDPVLIQDSIRVGLAEGEKLWDKFETATEVKRRLLTLSARETEVCDLLVQGLHTKEVALQLSISPSTVEKHRLKVFDKLDVHSVARLIRLVAGLD